jgi:glycosyltransferase involved in cell wall biosynthesis
MSRKVLIVNHAVELGGAERVLLRNLDSLDHDLFSPALACPADGPLAREARLRGLPVFLGHPAPRLLNIRRRSLGGSLTVLPLYAWDMTTSVLRLARLIGREGFDLVYTNSAKADIYGSLAGGLAGRPVVWRLHDIVDAQAFGRLNRILFRTCATLCAERVLAVSDAVRRAFIALGVDAAKVVTVYNGIDLDQAEAAADGSQARRDLGIAADAPVAGFVGRLVDWKGVDYFIRAAVRVASELPEARFLVVGDAVLGEQSYADSMRALARDSGLEEVMVFTGWREDIPSLIRAMDVLVHSSILPEPLATVIIEAMALERPVVAARDGGVPEMVVEGETGMMVPPRDVEAMAAAVVTILRDRGLAQRMGEAGRRRAAELFELEANTRCLEKELTEAMEGHRRGTRRGRRRS